MGSITLGQNAFNKKKCEKQKGGKGYIEIEFKLGKVEENIDKV